MFDRSIAFGPDPKLVQHELARATSNQLAQSLSQSQTEPFAMKSIGHQLQADPIGSETIKVFSRLARALVPRPIGRQTQCRHRLLGFFSCLVQLAIV
jgi:hypothetical protein